MYKLFKNLSYEWLQVSKIEFNGFGLQYPDRSYEDDDNIYLGSWDMVRFIEAKGEAGQPATIQVEMIFYCFEFLEVDVFLQHAALPWRRISRDADADELINKALSNADRD